MYVDVLVLFYLLSTKDHDVENSSFITGIALTAYSPLGSPDRPASNKESEPIVLNNPVLQKIADKHNTTIALVRCVPICLHY